MVAGDADDIGVTDLSGGTAMGAGIRLLVNLEVEAPGLWGDVSLTG
jgi:hypothetical protein